MARSIRATSLLLIALGAAAPALPASAAAANAGGAAPGGEVVSSAPGSGGSVGGAAPGAVPAQRASSSRTGGALAGHKPPRRKIVRRRTTTPKARQPTARPPTEPTPPTPTVAGVFPVQGPYSFGGPDLRFGAPRNGHTHQGQDVLAASGTPIVAPLSGSILWKGNQPGAAGIYLVEHGSDGRDYVFMHIKRATVLVTVGEAVAAGQQLAQVGATGDASGPHLHFEIWVGGWYARGGAPIDPLPQLKRWAGL
jgi:murein DD-endopeptidase MepM/ murein hydrolase activator NlpD